eukprot:GFKZ01004148.1.p1 GENE.GFKZ01004148.1~~GFKZ01004148.1.p1  ORF type:complete len:741 (-),score=60.23 GFKZ01004148.1:660-2882(-)
MDVSDPVSSQMSRPLNSNLSTRLPNPSAHLYTTATASSFQDQPFTHPLQQPPQSHPRQHPTHPHSQLHPLSQQQRQDTHPLPQTQTSYPARRSHRQVPAPPRHGLQHPLNPPLPVFTPQSHQEDPHTLQPEKLPTPQPRSSLLLSRSDSELLSTTYSDFFAPLRKYPNAAEWILQWLFSAYPAMQDAANLDIKLSRGFRFMHVCGARDCVSIDGGTILQNISTLLLPVESRGAVVCGYFTETTSDHVASLPLRSGKYVYCPQARELMMVSKVRGPASATSLLTACINRTCLVGTGMFVKDDVMASFSWQTYSGRVPEHYIVHSRTLSFYKLVRTAHQAGIEGHISRHDLGSLGENKSDFPLSDSSFLGLGTFGIFDVALVPTKLSPGAQSSGEEAPSLSCGTWAIPEHTAICNKPQLLFLGMFPTDLAAMRAQFVQTYGHRSAQIQRQGHGDAAGGLEEGQQLAIENVISSSRRPPLSRERLSQVMQRPRDAHGYNTDPIHYGDKNVVPSFATLPVVVTAPITSAVQYQTGSSQQQDTSIIAAETRNRNYPTESATAPATMPLGGAGSLVLPLQRQIAVATGQPFHGGTEEALEEVQPSVVESIDVSVAPQASSPTGDRGQQNATGMKFAPPVVSYGAVPTSSGGPSNVAKPQAISTSSFKKALPAPTKNEIVIRNRISAQRSNEKRRRKIEATRHELAYLKSTYLPQLEQKKGILINENQSLRLRLMTRYPENDFESFF